MFRSSTDAYSCMLLHARLKVQNAAIALQQAQQEEARVEALLHAAKQSTSMTAPVVLAGIVHPASAYVNMETDFEML